jgi:hypothetical protein
VRIETDRRPELRPRLGLVQVVQRALGARHHPKGLELPRVRARGAHDGVVEERPNQV